VVKKPRYLEQLQLDHKVSVKDGRLSTIDLSQEQRKRLALLAAWPHYKSIHESQAKYSIVLVQHFTSIIARKGR
jgi:hypothetical protein